MGLCGASNLQKKKEVIATLDEISQYLDSTLTAEQRTTLLGLVSSTTPEEKAELINYARENKKIFCCPELDLLDGLNDDNCISVLSGITMRH